jgi:AcrR family transcriptional regulator
MALNRESWIRAALFAIADGGTAAVAVEPLAERLGATKGSFYWHFRNRDELIEEALRLWEREGTDAFIERLAPVADPVERLRRLLAEAMDDEAQGSGPADATLLASGADPLVAPVIDRVQRKRLAFLEGCFRELGLPPAAARDRARLAYSVYLGWFAQLPAAGERQPSARERAAYERAAIELLTRPRPGASAGAGRRGGP